MWQIQGTGEVEVGSKLKEGEGEGTWQEGEGLDLGMKGVLTVGKLDTGRMNAQGL